MPDKSGRKVDTQARLNRMREIFANLEFQLRPETFFQVNTEAALALLEAIIAQLDLQGDEFLIDAYCGLGTFTLPLAQRCHLSYGGSSHFIASIRE